MDEWTRLGRAMNGAIVTIFWSFVLIGIKGLELLTSRNPILIIFSVWMVGILLIIGYMGGVDLVIKTRWVRK